MSNNPQEVAAKATNALAIDVLVIDALAIDALLPQTQCTRCGYQGCMPYAQAIATGLAPINRCPPGGQKTIDALAQLLNVSSLTLDPAHGVEAPRRIAKIDPEVCIGCTKCIQVCPVDAIIGRSKRMHSVLTVECTGCDLCVPSCPVDCIEMVPDSLARVHMSQADTQLARRRYDARRHRLEQRKQEQAAKIEAKRAELKQAVAAEAVDGHTSNDSTKPNRLAGFNVAELLAQAKAQRAKRNS